MVPVARILIVLLLAGCAFTAAIVLSNPSQVDPPDDVAESTGDWDFSGQTYPVIYAGDSITAPMAITSLGDFQPYSGADRSIVNPAAPLIEQQRRITFSQPGEYYVVINGNTFVKTVVLDPDEPVSESVARVFNFCCANMIAANRDDKRAGAGFEEYSRDWFLSDDPAILLCGPTKFVLEGLIADRFGLPVRHVTFPGVVLENGVMISQTHNVIEVYLPDLESWVLCDVNNAFLPCWESAFDVSRRVYALGIHNRRLVNEEWDSLGFVNHPGVPDVFQPVTQSPLPETPIEAMASPRLIRDVRGPQLSILFLGGPAYWGWPGRGTAFLESDYNFACQHEDERLRQRVIDWIGEYDIDVTFHGIDELESRLNDGHRSQIEAKAWMSKISVSQRTSLRR